MTERKHYPSDLTDAQWQRLEPFVAAKSGGRKCAYDRRDILDAIFYVTRSGGSWRMLPHDFPPFNLVHYYFRRWVKDGTWERLNTTLRTQERTRQGRNPKPSAAIVDSQSVKTTEKGARRAAMTQAKK